MIIRSMTADFGRLEGETLELEPGLNVIARPNESGKSTWCAFIRAMLYGVDTAARERAGVKPDKLRYAPWSGAPMSGTMELEYAGREITLTRWTKSASSPMREFRAVYSGTAEPVPGLTGASAGEALIGAGREIFRRSAFIGQGEAAVTGSAELERRIASVVSTGEEGTSCTEALSRLRHPELGWISPDIFIRLAEKNHLITQITELQLRRVCRFLRENPALRASIANVKINLSPLDLIQSESGSHLVRILGEYGLPCSCFQFEITETVATEYSASLTRVAESLQAAGIGLCLDDFGSGYANLNTVMQLPFSVIKLDRSLLFHICTDKNAALFYQSIVSAFCRLGYRIVAEGVETQEEMELLRSWNVDMIQGYYFSRPLPPDDLLRLLTGSAEMQAENQA